MKNVELEDGKSADIVSDNIEKMKELFPDAFSEGGVNFDTLRQLLGDASVLDEGEEKYGLNWHGKKKARQIALTPSTGTLLPCPDESVGWSTTQNLFIEGDNLEVLKLLQKSYANKVKMIYIDPPYNKEKDFIYPDKFQDDLNTYLEYTGQIDSDGFKLTSNSESTGRKHTNWLNMMYPRIRLAKSLLNEQGLIFISIDENEYSRLKALCEEVFGDSNYIGTFIWKRKAGGGDDSEHLAIEHEYILCFGKNTDYSKLKNIQHESPSMTAKYNREENGRRYYLERLDKTSLTYSESMDYPIECPDGTKIYPPQPSPDNRTTIWRWSKNKVKESASEIEFHKDKKTDEWRVYTRTWESLDGVTARSLLVEKQHGRNRDGSQEVAEILGPKVFSNPKPTRFLSHLLNIGAAGKDDIVLDFFAGSGSVAHASILSSIENNVNRRFILVQLPEKLDKSKKAQAPAVSFCEKLGVKPSISEISKERIRRVIANTDSKETDVDLGFKVFTLSTSSLQAWNPDRTDLEKSLLSHEEHLVEGRTEQDVLYELLLKRGVDLTVPIESRKVSGKNIYSIGYGVLFACLDESITKEQVEDIAQAIITWHGELAPTSDTHVFFRDSAFRDDVSKTNMAAILEQNGITHVRSL